VARNYKRENEVTKSKPKNIAKRVARNKKRREYIREGRVRVGDGKELDHIKPISKGGSNKKSNIRITTKSQNSSFDRNPDKSVKKNRLNKKKKKTRKTRKKNA
jgi:5-methylcytosine-specific restriction endonuclease McrA